jgi:tripartite-type tricarboxylate transporter receptor subunit TctC
MPDETAVKMTLPVSKGAFMRMQAAAAVLSAALAFSSGSARAQSVEEFYKGRNVSMVIGFSAGSGYDIYARLLARYMGRYIPGKPTIVSQNMPGAGSLRAAQYVGSVAPKDGSVLGTMSRSLPVEPLIGDAKFDGRAFSWIGNIANNNSVCATWHDTGIKTWQDAMTKPFVLGGEGPGSDLDNFALIMKNMFGAKVKLVSGYPGGTEVNLAIERRELDGRCGWSWDSIRSTKPDWLRDKKINLLAVFALEKAPDMAADVPLALDKVQNEEQREVLRVHLAGQAFGRPFFAAQGIPEDRKAALRAAFDATMKDPEFIAEAEKLRLEVSPMKGVEIERLLNEVYALPKELIDKARAAIRN